MVLVLMIFLFLNRIKNNFSTSSAYLSLSEPIIILDWVIISSFAVLCVRNSGEKIIFKFENFFYKSLVTPGKTVDLIIYIGLSTIELLLKKSLI